MDEEPAAERALQAGKTAARDADRGTGGGDARSAAQDAEGKAGAPWAPGAGRGDPEMFYSTGVRISELAGMNVDHVDVYTETVRVFGKGRKERLCPIGSHALTALQRYRSKEGVHDGRSSAARWANA